MSSKRLFLDTNVVLDLLGNRDPYYEPMAKIASLADSGDIDLVVSPISYATVHYFLSKFEGAKVSLEKLRKLKVLCEICTLDEQIIEKGLNSSFKDFEDALQYFSATSSRCEIIVTRNAKDFKKSLLPVMSPDAFLKSR